MVVKLGSLKDLNATFQTFKAKHLLKQDILGMLYQIDLCSKLVSFCIKIRNKSVELHLWFQALRHEHLIRRLIGFWICHLQFPSFSSCLGTLDRLRPAPVSSKYQNSLFRPKKAFRVYLGPIQ